MYPFWDIALAPVIRAAHPRRVVEVGALRGETTELMLGLLAPDAELHVIDPLPRFDPAEHERRFPGRYVFHRATSHAVLPELEAADVALIDGDHNWFTVHGELQMLADSARRAGRPLPVLIMHDVCWPYGRRDLYYDPATVPAEHRQPHARRGMRPGQRELAERGGVNPTLDNALEEGGSRNGVMTALDDFVAEYEGELRVVVLPVYFGLAIVADATRLEESPELRAELDRLEGANARLELMKLAESERLRSLVGEHEAVFGAQAETERAARRYLAVLKGALLNRHYLEDELRMEYLAACATAGRPPDPLVVRDPAHHLRRRYAPLELSRAEGAPPRDAAGPSSFPYATLGARRLDHLERCLDVLRTEAVAGDLLDCGVGRGGAGVFMRGYLEAFEIGTGRVWVADRFLNPELAEDDAAADLNMVRRAFARFDLLDGRVRFLQGPPAESIPGGPDRLALARVDASRAGAPGELGEVLAVLHPRIATGGFVVVDGLDRPGARAELEAFRERFGIADPALRVDSRAIAWRRLEPGPSEPTPIAGRPAPLPLAPPTPGDACDLSVVVVFHDMRREAQRTLHSLTRAYQRGIEALDYEVIAIENGSAPEQRLGAELVASFGPEFRYLDMGADAEPSPGPAVNRALEQARGRTIAFMIDGAHVLTPGVLRYAMEGARMHAPAIVATQQWYVGPGQQVETVGEGYGRDFEDDLFARIGWPDDGYRLFEIGHFVGTRDWFDGMWESNCLFVPREIIEQVGALDESFASAGGGFANLDLYERVAASPGISVVTILGEGSFHQVHGGTTTNEDDSLRRAGLLASYNEEYLELRGRRFRIVNPFFYVGGMVDTARRTRPRRMGANAFLRTARQLAGDGLPESPAPMPAETEAEFTEAYWRSFRWRQASWLGRPLERAPGDLAAYAQMVFETRPEWVVATSRDGAPGRDLYLASLCELAGHGRVLAVGTGDAGEEHPRIERIEGDPAQPDVAVRIRERVGKPGRALLVLGRDGSGPLVEAFNGLAELVPVGSWAVFEETIMNGHPIWPAMGPGPAEAVAHIVHRHAEWVPDRGLEQLGVSFNRGGYLRRSA